MDKKELQISSMYIVSESHKSKLAKLQLLNFIMEASEHQLMAFILDDQIISIDELGEQIVEARFKASNIMQEIRPKTKTYFSTTGMLGLTGVDGAIIWAAYRKIRSSYDVCTRQCGKFELNTVRRQYCMAKCKVVKIQGKLGVLKSSVLAKGKNPEKFRASKTKEIAKAQKNLLKAMNNVKKYEAHASKRSTKY